MKRLAIAFAIFLTGCAPAQQWTPKEEVSTGEYRLPIIETTDIHGHIVDPDGKDIQYRLAYIADKVNDIRGEDKDRLLLLDGGDIYQGASVSNLLGGRPVYVAMDKMGYDAVALGNHEFDWDISTLVDSDATMPDYEWDGLDYANEVPVLCANLFLNGSRASFSKDYVVVEKSATSYKGESIKVKIGIIGFAMNYASSIMASKFSEKGYSIKEDYTIANKIAADLEKSGQCDATVLLVHGKAENAAEKLGKGSVIDLVLGGHSHQAAMGKASGITYMQGGRYNENYAYAELVFNSRDGKASFKNVENQKIPGVEGNLSGKDEKNFDKDIIAVSDEAISAIERQMNDVVGYISIGATTYYLNGSGGKASTMSNWMCDIMRRIGDADVSFLNNGGIRTTFPLSGQKRRDITVSDIYEIFPFSNTIYVYKVTYSDLLLLLEYSLTKSGSSILSHMTGIDCHYSGQAVRSLVKNGTTIYRDGQWTADWKSRSLILAVSEFLATSVRTDWDTQLENPLPKWNNTARLLSNSDVDNENAVRVLREEAKASGGHLYIDNKPYFILAD